MRDVQRQLAHEGDERLAAIEAPLREGIAALEWAVRFIADGYASDAKKPPVGAVPFLELLVIVAGGWQMARTALVSFRRLREGDGDAGFMRAKLETARFYADHVLARAPGLAHTVVHGAAGALAIEDDQF
jgi:acyl-CoA dehydrogenase